MKTITKFTVLLVILLNSIAGFALEEGQIKIKINYVGDLVSTSQITYGLPMNISNFLENLGMDVQEEGVVPGVFVFYSEKDSNIRMEVESSDSKQVSEYKYKMEAMSFSVDPKVIAKIYKESLQKLVTEQVPNFLVSFGDLELSKFECEKSVVERSEQLVCISKYSFSWIN